MVTMRKYPEAVSDCSSSPCYSSLILRPIRESYMDTEQVCCEGYEEDPKTG